jgi:hypothetical protein
LHPADWSEFGKRAGFIRNVEMVDSLDPATDRVIAAWDGQSNGTLHAVRAARAKGISVSDVGVPTEDA